MSGLRPKTNPVIFIFNYEFPPLGGGGGKASFWIARGLAKHGAEVKVITSSYRGLSRRERLDGVEIVRIPVIRRRIYQASVFEMCTYIVSSTVYGLWEAKEEVPHMSLVFFGIPSGIAAFLLKKVYGVPYFISLRGGDVPGSDPHELSFYYYLTKPFVRALWRQARGVIANSEGLKQLAQLCLPEIEVHVVPNGIDDEFFQNGEQFEGRSDSTFRIFYAGRFAYQKGLDVLFRSLKLVPKGLKKTELLLAGDGPERKRLEEMARKEVPENIKVKFLGWIERHNLYQKYREVDIFVLPSRGEGMPNTVLEAMASGLPIVATRVAGNEELVQEGVNGLLVPPNDPVLLAEAISKIMTDEELRRRMGAQGRDIAKTYSWDMVVNRYLEIMGIK